MAFRNIIGKNVLSIFEGDMCGYVLGVEFKDKMQGINSLLVVDEELDIDYMLRMCDVYTLDNEYVVIKNKTKLQVATADSGLNMNATIVGVSGKDYGIIQDIIFANNYKIDKIICNNYDFTPQKVLNVGKNIILINDTDRKLYRYKFAPQTKIDSSTKNIMPVEILPHNTLPTPIRANNTATLLGKRLARDLISNAGEILARKNSVVTIQIINTAKQFNIMAQLIQCVK